MQKIQYGLQLPNNQLAAVEPYNQGFQLVKHGETWLVDSPECLQNTLFDNQPIYNSEYDCPNWGSFKRHELTPVKVITTTEPIEITLPLNIEDIFLIRDIPHKVAQHYTGLELENHRYVWCIVNFPKEYMHTYTNQTIHFGSRYNKHLLVATIDIPEEYLPTLKYERNWNPNKHGCCLITKPTPN